MSVRNVSVVYPWSASCFSSFFWLPAKYCFRTCLTRLSISLSVTAILRFVRFLRELDPLHEERHSLRLQRLVLGGPRLGEVALLGDV